jgi:hypothetical protein
VVGQIDYFYIISRCFWYCVCNDGNSLWCDVTSLIKSLASRSKPEMPKKGAHTSGVTWCTFLSFCARLMTQCNYSLASAWKIVIIIWLLAVIHSRKTHSIYGRASLLNQLSTFFPSVWIKSCVVACLSEQSEYIGFVLPLRFLKDAMPRLLCVVCDAMFVRCT